MERFTPNNEEETAELVREAATTHASFEIVSGGTKRGLGRKMEADALLDISALSGILAYEPDELILTARAATSVAEIEAALSKHSQMLAFAPPDWGPLFGERAGRATLAGITAANTAGSRRVKAGGVRDHLIGCRFVNGLGEIIKAGGRVVKNVTGFDIPKLMCGAFGTLGVLSELTFRLVPAAPRAAVIALRNCTAADGLAALRQAAGLPLEPTGLAYLPAAACAQSASLRSAGLGQTNGVALIRVEGSQDPVIDKLARLQSAFDTHDITVLEDDIGHALFGEIGDGTPFLEGHSDIWQMFVPPSQAHDAVTASEAPSWFADWAGGVLWLGMAASHDVEERLRDITTRLGGHVRLIRASEAARARLSVFQPEQPARAALSRAVKNAFDPARLFNPGRMFEDI